MREGLQGRVTRALAQPGIQEQQALLESLTDNRDRLPSSSLTPSFILRCFRSSGCVAHCGSTAQARRPAFAGRASLRGGRRRHRIPAGSARWQYGEPAARWPRCNASRGSTLNVRTGQLRTQKYDFAPEKGAVCGFLKTHFAASPRVHDVGRPTRCRHPARYCCSPARCFYQHARVSPEESSTG